MSALEKIDTKNQSLIHKSQMSLSELDSRQFDLVPNSNINSIKEKVAAADQCLIGFQETVSSKLGK